MYNPCLECQIRYGHDYTEECDNKCQYAYAIKENKIKTAKLVSCGFDDRLKCSLCDYILTDTEELRLNSEFHRYCGHCGAKFEDPVFKIVFDKDKPTDWTPTKSPLHTGEHS